MKTDGRTQASQPWEGQKQRRWVFRSALLWLGLQLNLQPATPLRVGRRLRICPSIARPILLAILKICCPAGAA